MHWKKMVIICCSTLTALFSWLLLHTQAKENSWHPPPNKQSQQSNPYKNYVCWKGKILVFLICSTYIYVNFYTKVNQIQVNNHEIVVNFFHISHNLTWYSAIVHKFTRIYAVCSTYEQHKTIHVNLCKKLRNQSQIE